MMISSATTERKAGVLIALWLLPALRKHCCGFRCVPM